MQRRAALRVLQCLLVLWAVLPVGGAAFAQDGPSYRPDLNQPMAFHRAYTGGNCLTCTWIAAQGVITNDTPEDFQRFLTAHNIEDLRGTYIHLNSAGGGLIAAIKLGEMIRALGAGTVVAETAGVLTDQGINDTFLDSDAPQCASACVFAFVGGLERTANAKSDSGGGPGFQLQGRLGVHQFYDPKVLLEGPGTVFDGLARSKDQILTGILLDYLHEMGVSTALLARGMTVAPWEDMHWLTAEEIASYALDTNASRDRARLVGYSNGVGVVEIRAEGSQSQSRKEFYCTRSGALRLKVVVDWSDLAWTAGAEETLNRLFEPQAVDFARSVRVVQQSHETTPEGRYLSDVVYAFEGVDLASLGTRTDFTFTVRGSPNQIAIMEGRLNMRLSAPFDGFYLLPRLCLP